VTSRFLALYLSGLLGLTCMLVSLITVVADAEWDRSIVLGISAVGATLSAVISLLCSWISAEHPINQSRLLRSLLAVLSIGLTLFLLVGVIG
jgi:hypothetical protein